jgi:site-specific DNA-adenine methylase
MNKPKRYGLPYMGSKSRIADKIINFLPCGNTFVDLFAGGCAVTHAALLSNKWHNFICNDITDSVRLFVEAIHGKYANENRWISREDFFKLKDTDAYVRLCFSFGNNQRDYLYSKILEPYKRAFHYAVCFSDYEPMKAFGMDWSELDNVKGRHERRLYVKQVLLPKYAELGVVKKCGSHYAFLGYSNGDCLQNVEAAESLERLQSLERDYRAVSIPSGAIIYADIPYKNTGGYGNTKYGGFDHEAFYRWAREINQCVFISEYQMPADFVCVAEFPISSTLAAQSNNTRRIERIFVHQRWAAKYARKSLFDFNYL